MIDLRDQFAMQAMRAFSSDKEEMRKLERGTEPLYDVAAKVCYKIADAMMLERGKGSEMVCLELKNGSRIMVPKKALPYIEVK